MQSSFDRGRRVRGTVSGASVGGCGATSTPWTTCAPCVTSSSLMASHKLRATSMPLDDPLADHRRIGLDSNVLIYLLARNPLAEALRSIFDGLESGRYAAVIASVALTDVLTGPAR